MTAFFCGCTWRGLDVALPSAVTNVHEGTGNIRAAGCGRYQAFTAFSFFSVLAIVRLA
jgi:hypothetical protein